MKTTHASDNNLPPEIINQFVENQGKQIALQEKQMVYNEKINQNQFEYAKEALRIKALHAKEERIYNDKKLTKIFFFAGIMFVVFLIFILALLLMGDADIAKEIFQIVSFNITGAIGGYGYAISKGKKNTPSSEHQN